MFMEQLKTHIQSIFNKQAITLWFCHLISLISESNEALVSFDLPGSNNTEMSMTSEVKV